MIIYLFCKFIFNMLSYSNRISNSNINTIESTNKIVNIDDKDYFCYKDNMDQQLKIKYPLFFEQFELTNFINKGSVGYVYEGKLKNGYNNNQKYAFKMCFSKENNEKKEPKNKFQEISIVKKLHHKYINQIMAFIKMDEKSYFSVHELGKYGDLDNFVNVLLKRKYLSETCINYLSKQILEALNYIHRCKIVHMDIKQGNILLDSELNIKIIDFSASCSYAEFDSEDIVKFPFIGTRKFISPEIMSKAHLKVKYAQKIDMYSLGVMLYYLAFGIYPYNLNDIRSYNYDEILQKIKSEKLYFPKEINISQKFKDFLSKLLEKDYEKRLTIKEALNSEWIKGWDIINDEKQNIACQENFLIKLITDNIQKFNEYLKL